MAIRDSFTFPLSSQSRNLESIHNGGKLRLWSKEWVRVKQVKVKMKLRPKVEDRNVRMKLK